MLACVGQNMARHHFSGRFFWIQVNKQKKVHTAFWQENNFKTTSIKQTQKDSKTTEWNCDHDLQCLITLLTDKWVPAEKEKYNTCMQICLSPTGTCPSWGQRGRKHSAELSCSLIQPSKMFREKIVMQFAKMWTVTISRWWDYGLCFFVLLYTVLYFPSYVQISPCKLDK